MGYGIALAADAISRAISDSFKGASEGHEERRKEEEAGRRARAAMADEAYQPIRFEQGQLANKQTRQQIDIAAAGEERNKKLFPSTLSTAESQATTAANQAFTTGVEARTAVERTRLAMDTAAEQLRLTKEQIKEAETKNRFLVPQLELEAKQKQLDYDKAKTAHDENLRAIDAINRISTQLMTTQGNLEKTMQVLSQPDARYLNANDAYLVMMRARMEMQARSEGKHNPYTVFGLIQQGRKSAKDNAEQEARALLTKIDRVGAESGGPGIPEMYAWLQQYSFSKQLKMMENPALGITFLPSEKEIPPMPKALVEKLAGNAGALSAIGITSAGWKQNYEIHSRMNEYVTAGVEWSEAMRAASDDYFKHQQGVPTASDRWVKPEVKGAYDPMETGSVAQGWKELKEGIGKHFLGGKGKTVPQDMLPPQERGAKGSPESRVQEMDKRNALNKLSLREYGVPWEYLNDPANDEAAGRKYILDLYEQQKGK